MLLQAVSGLLLHYSGWGLYIHLAGIAPVMFFVLWSTGRCVHLSDRRLTRWSYAVVALLGVQILMGTMAYIYRPDPFLANTHLVTGLLLVVAVLVLIRVSTDRFPQ